MKKSGSTLREQLRIDFDEISNNAVATDSNPSYIASNLERLDDSYINPNGDIRPIDDDPTGLAAFLPANEDRLNDMYYEKLSDQPLAVKIDDWKMAVAGISKYISLRNRYGGVESIRQQPGNEFNQRYGWKADETEIGMQKKVDELKEDAYNWLDTLVAARAMHVNGYNEEEIQASRDNVWRDITEELGPVTKFNRARRQRYIKEAEELSNNSTVEF